MQFYGYSGINIHAGVNSDVDKVFNKSEVVATRFGRVDTYCCAKYIGNNASGNDLSGFSGKMYELAFRHRHGPPLGFGAMLVVYPLLITEGISGELAEFIKQFSPKHFGAAEFASVLDLSTNYLYYNPKTPVWGSAYFASYRKDVFRFYSPLAWKEFKR